MIGARILVLATAAAAGACAPVPAETATQEAFNPAYQGVQTLLLDGDLVNFRVMMTGARGPEDVTKYAECAAAQYTLIRGYGFARHLRTTVEEESGIWRADAVYTISPALPDGLKTIDAEVTVADCGQLDIPTV